MFKFIVRILSNALAVFLAAYFVINFTFPINNWKLLLLTGLVLAIFNVILKPILKFISTPLIILTLGLFTLIINGLILWLLTKFIPELKISSLAAYFWGIIIISLINWLIGLFLKNKPKSNV